MLNRRRGGTSVALADLDGDGALDLYLTNYHVNTVRDQPKNAVRVQDRQRDAGADDLRRAAHDEPGFDESF